MITIVFKIVYTPLLAIGPIGEAYSEQASDLHMFLSRDLITENKYDVTVFNVTEKVHRKISIKIGNVSITSISGIGFNAYCRTWGEQGYECKSTAGSGFLYIEDIISAISDRSHCRSLSFNVALVEHTSLDEHKKYTVKGRIKLLLIEKECQFPSSIQIDRSPAVFLYKTNIESYWRRYMLKLCQSTIYEVNDLFQPSEPRELMERIRCSFYVNNRLVIPGSSYTLYDSRRLTHISVFEHLLHVSLRRHGIKSKEMHKLIKTDDLFFKNHQTFADVIAHMLCAITWTLPYLSDFVNQNRTYPFKQQLLDNVMNEHYKPTLIVAEGDCDGLTWLTNLMENHAQYITVTSVHTLTSRMLQLLQRFYVPLMIQGAATIGNAADLNSDSTEGLLCHTWGVLMPLYAVQQALQNVPQKILGTEKVKSFYDDDREHVLNVILMEGTGPCCPLQLSADDSVEPLKHHVQAIDKLEYEYPVLQELQRLMYRHKTGTSFSMFYKSAVTAYTSYFYRKYGISSLDVCFVRSIKSTMTYGITAKELFSLSPSNGIYLFNDLNRTVHDDVKLIDVIQGVLQQLEPIPLMMVPSTEQSAAVKKHVNNLLHSSLYSNFTHYQQADHAVTDSVVYYCRLDNLTSELMSALHALHKRGAILTHNIIPLVTTELQLESKDKVKYNFPFTVIEIEIDLSNVLIK